MTESSHSFSYRFFARWATFSYRNAASVILAAILLASLCAVYTSRNLGVHTDTTEMLSEELPFRANDIRYMAEFPQHNEAMLLVMDAPTPEQAYSAAKRLTATMKQDTIHIDDAYYLSGDSFLERNGLLFKSIPELGDITDHLAAAQPLISRIAGDPTLYTFATILTEAVEELRTGRKLELAPILSGVSTTIDARLTGEPRALSWQVLFSGEKQENTYQDLILVKPNLDYSQIFSAQQSITAIREAAQQIGLTDNSPEKLRITGEAALAYDELNSAMLGAQEAGLLALVMVAVVLFFALRTAGAILAVLLSLVLGIILTAAFAAFAVGHLNLISIAFAVLYVGLGVDYAIHFLLRHQELKGTNLTVLNALHAASGDIGRALAVCAITTAIGFYAFIPTAYQGVAELGIISGTGMLISLIVTLTIVPALQRYLPIRKRKLSTSNGKIGSQLLDLPIRLRKLVYLITLLALITAFIVLPKIKFDYNLLNLNDPQAESVQTFQELLADEKDSAWHSVVLADSQHEAKQIVTRLAKLPEVDKVVSIFDLTPSEQAEKLVFINEMALTLGPIVFLDSSVSSNGYTIAEQRAALVKLNNLLAGFVEEQPDHQTATSILALNTVLTRFLEHLNTLGPEGGNNELQLLDAVSHDLLGLLPGALERLQVALEAIPFTQQELPESLSSHWYSQNGVYRIAVYPTDNIGNNDALRQFVRAVQQEAPQATGVPVISLEAGEAVVDAFIHAFSLALVGVILALLLLLRNFVDTLLVMTPLLLAALFTCAATVLLEIPFNFANIIALPLLLGIGIDCSIHMVHRCRNAAIASESLLHTSTARAIYYSALTTLAGFGSLAFSPHQGTASMGLLLAVGVVLTLICVLVILPALLYPLNQHKVQPKILS
jgi:uncharacterized protein